MKAAIETDYLIIGAGATGMAFADTLLDETDADITIVDRHGRPGGHWNDAYGFVALHQPSAFYGVNSLPLGSDRKDAGGVNDGLYELASGPQISGYYDAVMRQRLLPSGRVRYLPMAEHRPDRVIESLLSGDETRVAVRRKIVDAAYGGPSVPSTHARRFEVEDGVRIVAPNELLHLWKSGAPRPSRFVILGAGKTAMDAIIWLLDSGASPDAIQWVKPRESWLIDRRTTQPGLEFFDAVFGAQAAQMQAFAEAVSVDDIFMRLEAAGVMLRIDLDLVPTMFHYATISRGEIEALRRVRDVVRKGRVRKITRRAMVLDGGEAVGVEGALYIDCTASAVERRATQPIFQQGRIVPQLVRIPQPTFSAALIAYVEAHYASDEEKNRICRPAPFPYDLSGYPAANLVNLSNQAGWGREEALGRWIRGCRLDGFGKLIAAADRQDPAKMAILERMRAWSKPAIANLHKLAAEATAQRLEAN